MKDFDALMGIRKYLVRHEDGGAVRYHTCASKSAVVDYCEAEGLRIDGTHTVVTACGEPARVYCAG